MPCILNQRRVFRLSLFAIAPLVVRSLHAVASHADTGRPKGWAVVKFELNEHAIQAISKFDELVFMNRQLSVRLDRTSFEKGDFSRLYIGNLPYDMTDEDLQEAFAPFNAIDSHVKVTASGRCAFSI